MAEPTIVIHGATEEIAGLLEASKTIKDVLTVQLYSGMANMIQRTQAYPPTAPSRAAPSTRPIEPYVRTGEYGQRQSLQITEVNGFIQGVLTQAASYSSYVRGGLEGQDPQAIFHADIWDTNQMIVNQETPALVEAMDTAILEKLRELKL